MSHAPTINAARESLLALHKALIDLLKGEYQRETGRALPPGELLQLLTGDSEWDWLHPYSQLVVSIDELLESGVAPTDEDAAAVRLEVERLIDGREKRHGAAVDRDTHVALEHGRLAATVERLPAAELDQHPALLERRKAWTEARRRRPRR